MTIISRSGISLSRRRFVTGAIAGSGLLGLGLNPFELNAGSKTNNSVIPEIHGNRFNLNIAYQAANLFEVDAQLFVGESGQYGARFEAEYELVLSRNQKWVLVPELELNAYSENDEQAGIGSGLSNLELGLRLNYYISRHIAPYIGVNWENKFGSAADFARAEREDTNDIQYVVGMRGWF